MNKSPTESSAGTGPWKRFIVEVYTSTGFAGSYAPEGERMAELGTAEKLERFFLEAVIPLIGDKQVKVKLIDDGDDAVVILFEGVDPPSTPPKGREFVPEWFKSHPLRG